MGGGDIGCGIRLLGVTSNKLVGLILLCLGNVTIIYNRRNVYVHIPPCNNTCVQVVVFF